MPSRNALLVSLLAVSLLLPSCGYRMSGTGNLLPEGTRTIAIPVFLNGTKEPMVDVTLTRAVVDEFLTDGRLAVTDLEGADVVLRGKITSYEAVPLSYTANAYVQQYQVKMVVTASLEDRRAKRVLWQEKGTESNLIAVYAVSYDPLGHADISATKTAKEEAIKKASRDLAQTLRGRVLEGF